MNYKPDEKDWMGWLYGELDDANRAKFEAYIAAHPEARLEMKKYESLRHLLAEAADKEVIAPSLLTDCDSRTRADGGHYFWRAPYFRKVVTIAASLLVIILAGKYTETRLTISPHEFRLTFGESPAEIPKEEPAVSTLSPEQVQQMIDASLQENNTVVKAGLEQTQEELEASIRSTLSLNSGRLDQVVREASTASHEQIKEYVDGIRTENMQQVKEYFQLTSSEQKQYIENLLVDFAKYLQQQRNNDLQLVQTRMSSLEQNTDIFKQETEQILSSIITTVGNPGTNEIKN